jgi:hypothetical protein
VGHGRQEGVTVDSAREIAGVCTLQVSTKICSAGWKSPALRYPTQVSGAARMQPTLAAGRGAVETVAASWLSTGAGGTK